MVLAFLVIDGLYIRGSKEMSHERTVRTAAIFAMMMTLLVMARVASALPIYDIDRMIGADGSVIGTIETNGDIGTITPTDSFVDWVLVLDVGGVAITLTPGNSTWYTPAPPQPPFFISELTATLDELIFEFPGPWNTVELYADSDRFGVRWLVSTDENLEAVILDGGNTFAQQTFNDPLVLGVAQKNSVPEPSSLALLSVSLAGLGFCRRYRRRQPNTV
jgi:hypothetical protein